MYVVVFIRLFLALFVYIGMRDGYDQEVSKPATQSAQNVPEVSKQQTNQTGDTMSIEVIPAGASAVVTDNDCDWESDAERVKDALAVMAAAQSVHFSTAAKDAGDKFINTIQDIKDAETRLHKAGGDWFINTIQDIKEVDAHVADAKGRVVDVVRETAFAAERSAAETRQYLGAAIHEAQEEAQECCCEIKDLVNSRAQDVLVSQLSGFKDAQALAYRLAAEADKTACANQSQTQLLFAQQSAQLAECCCELKELIKDKTAEVTALINSQEVDRLRERANKAENQLSLLELIKQVVGGGK